MKELPSILFVDDERTIRKYFEIDFKDEFRSIVSTESAEEALNYLEHNSVDVIISDQKMGNNMSGAEFLIKVRHLYPQTQRIMITVLEEYEFLKACINEGDVHGFIAKPWSKERVTKQILDVFSQKQRSISQDEKINERVESWYETLKNARLSSLIDTFKELGIVVDASDVRDILSKISENQKPQLVQAALHNDKIESMFIGMIKKQLEKNFSFDQSKDSTKLLSESDLGFILLDDQSKSTMSSAEEEALKTLQEIMFQIDQEPAQQIISSIKSNQVNIAFRSVGGFGDSIFDPLCMKIQSVVSRACLLIKLMNICTSNNYKIHIEADSDRFAGSINCFNS